MMVRMVHLWLIMVAFSVFTAAAPRRSNDTSLATDLDPCATLSCSSKWEVCQVNSRNQPACVCRSCDVNEPLDPICDNEGYAYRHRCDLEKQICMTGRMIVEVQCLRDKIVLPKPCKGRGTISPWIENTVTNYTFHIGRNETIVCEAHGIPRPIVQWLKDDVPVSGKLGEVRASENQLIFTLATDASVGTYQCVAINCASFSKISAIGAIPAIHNIHVNVSRDEHCGGVPGLRPTQIKGIRDRTYKVGQRMVVRCKTKGLPKATIRWEKYGVRGVEEVVPDGNVDVVGDALIFRSGRKTHEGTYVCFAWNCANEDKDFAIVRLDMEEDVENFRDHCLQNTWDSNKKCNLENFDFWIYDVTKRKCVLTNRQICSGMYNAHSSEEVCASRCMTHCDISPDDPDGRRRDYEDEPRNQMYPGCDQHQSYKGAVKCSKVCNNRNKMLEDKLTATANYTQPDPRQLNCPETCDQSVVNGYCRDDFIIKVDIVSTQLDMWFDVRVDKLLYLSKNVSREAYLRMKSTLVDGARVQLKMGHRRSCRCPDADSVFIGAQRDRRAVLMSGRYINEVFTIVDHSIFKLYKSNEESHLSHFYPGICQIIFGWGNNTPNDFMNANVNMIPMGDEDHPFYGRS